MEWYSVLIAFGSLLAVVWNTVGMYNVILFGVRVRRLGSSVVERLGWDHIVTKCYVGWVEDELCSPPCCNQSRQDKPWNTGRCYEVSDTANGYEYRECPIGETLSEGAPLPFFAATINLKDGDTIDVYKQISMFAFRGNTIDEPFWNWFIVEIIGMKLDNVVSIQTLDSKTFSVTSFNMKNSIQL